ncbi:PEP-CTERM protein-sorting domain-containing protein [Rubritalea squalenifaciens DSM 18772]|uniref:PEP-CTERM protein-sorting domain-containing protein n=1 Tax=Rubritalea squalenifaciens DSM 18772 TaxID=1123071 RepID=A0A1M6EQF4_9BACT|nr:PEP-CTERM sorting domain-containing protein [Rubritalea squalenifaciens]SHI87724.1 PEP-CTERM protein-sorting domain-containing protein [Rubritalea squalenifaciens DSM 18772]
MKNRTHTKKICTALAACALSTSASSLAATIITTDADTFVQGTTNTTNHGSAESLLVKRSSAGAGSQFTRTTWIHFDTTTLTGVATAADASFTITVDGGGTNVTSGTISLWGIVDGQAGDALGTDWTESGINGANAPQKPDFTDGAITQLLGTITLDATNTADGASHIFTSPELLGFLQANSNDEVTFMLTRSQNDGNFTYYSKENTSSMDAATLSITPAAIPEPTSSALIGLAGIGFLLRRRR